MFEVIPGKNIQHQESFASYLMSWVTQELKIEMALLSLYKPKDSVKYLLEKKIEREEAVSGCYLGMVVLDQIDVLFR